MKLINWVFYQEQHPTKLAKTPNPEEKPGAEGEGNHSTPKTPNPEETIQPQKLSKNPNPEKQENQKSLIQRNQKMEEPQKNG